MTEQDRGEHTIRFKEIRLALAKLLAASLIVGGIGLIILQISALSDHKPNSQQPTPTPASRIIDLENSFNSPLQLNTPEK